MLYAQELLDNTLKFPSLVAASGNDPIGAEPIGSKDQLELYRAHTP